MFFKQTMEAEKVESCEMLHVRGTLMRLDDDHMRCFEYTLNYLSCRFYTMPCLM